MNILRGLWDLTWVEVKIFLREPLGAIGTIVMPVLAFVVLGKATAGRTVPTSAAPEALTGCSSPGGIPTLVSMLITISAVLSLVTIISIYREGGILKRLRATPLRPWTILTAHVLVKLLLTALTMMAMVLAGRRYFAIGPSVPSVQFYDRAAVQHAEHSLDWIHRREHRSDRTLRAADRRADSLSDGRALGIFRAG